METLQKRQDIKAQYILLPPGGNAYSLIRPSTKPGVFSIPGEVARHLSGGLSPGIVCPWEHWYGQQSIPMRSLYLLRPHGTASLDGEQLVVTSDEQELDRMSLPLLDQILMIGHMQLTTQLIRACLRRGIPIAYLSKSGQCLGRLQPMEQGYRHRARRQAALPEERRLAIARTLVSGKIANGRVVLQRLTRRAGRPAVEGCLRRLGQLQALSGRAPNPSRLRGLEGSAAALYFRGLGGALAGDGFGFTVRSRRPPLTPFDALCGCVSCGIASPCGPGFRSH